MSQHGVTFEELYLAFSPGKMGRIGSFSVSWCHASRPVPHTWEANPFLLMTMALARGFIPLGGNVRGILKCILTNKKGKEMMEILQRKDGSRNAEVILSESSGDDITPRFWGWFLSTICHSLQDRSCFLYSCKHWGQGIGVGESYIPDDGIQENPEVIMWWNNKSSEGLHA